MAKTVKIYSSNEIDNMLSNLTQKCYDTSTSDTAGTWNVTIPGVTTLSEGLTIKIRLKTSYNSITNTLNLNGLGAKIVYFRYGSKLTSHYAKESVLALTYTTNAVSSGTDTSGWIIENVGEIPNYGSATSSKEGLVKLGSDTVQSAAANSPTNTSGKTYPIQKNSSGQLVVNVPWSAGSTSIPSELAKIVNSGANNIQIERYGSSSYGMRIQTGKVSVNKAETVNQDVSFPNSTLFSGIPVVILTPVINNTADTRQLDIELTGVTKTGFHFSCALSNTSYKITEVHYIAIQLI